MKRVCFLNGRWLSEKGARVSAFDAGFLYGYGVFETIRVVNARAFLLQAHLRRLKKSLRLTGIKEIPYNLNSVVNKILQKNNLTDGVVRITVSAGRFLDLPWQGKSERSTVLVTVRKVKIPEYIYKKGVKIVFLSEKISGPSLSFPGVKSTSYITNVISKIYAMKKGAFEAIFLSPQGFLKEGTTSNLFFIKDRVLCTPDLESGILPGVTRDIVIKIARKMGLKVKEGNFRVTDFYNSDEGFLTNSVYGIVPIAGKGKDIVNELRRIFSFYEHYSPLPFYKQRPPYLSLQPSTPCQSPQCV